MPIEATVYRCLIASPSDVTVERAAIAETIESWNARWGETRGIRIEPVRWEHASTPGASPNGPQALLNRQLVDGSDLAIGVFWTTVGTPTRAAQSGTVEELDLAQQAGKPVMVYFCIRDIPQAKLGTAGWSELISFKAKFATTNLYSEFQSTEELKRKVFEHLSSVVPTLAGSQPSVVALPPASGDRLPRAADGDARVDAANYARFEVKQTAVNRTESAFSPTFKITRVDGRWTQAIFCRSHALENSSGWTKMEVPNLPRSSFQPVLDFSSAAAAGASQGNLEVELRFLSDYGWRRQVHVWPIRIANVPGKRLWDIGSAIALPRYEASSAPDGISA